MSQIVPFEEIPTSKKVPSSTKILELLGKSDIVKERYSVSVQPYSGQGAGIGSGLNQKITFKIFNNADYADLATAYLTFQSNFGANGGSLDQLNFEDNVLSWFNLVRTLVNDQVVEEIANFNIWANLITYASMSKSYYETAGSFMGCYRHSKYLAGGPRGLVKVNAIAGGVAGAVSTLDFGTQAQGQQLWEQLDNGAPSWQPTATIANPPTGGSGGNDSFNNFRVKTPSYWSAPLAGYLGLFSLDKYFPLRSVSSITLELNLPTNIKGVLFNNLLPVDNNQTGPTASFTAVGVQKLSLQNMYIHYDCVKMSDAYYELMDSELLDPNGLGVQYSVNTVEGITANVPSTGGKSVLIASKGTRFLKSFWAVATPSYTYQSGNNPPSSVFLPMGFQSAQLVVNSKRFPQYLIDNFPRAYAELAKSTNKFHSVVGDSIITYPKYAQDVDAQVQNSISARPDLEYACFMLGFNLEQVLDAPEITLQGENTLTAGFQIQLELTTNPTGIASTVYMFPHFAKVLKIKGGTIQILN